MSARARSVLAAGVLLASVSLVSAATLECSTVGSAYDSLFADGNTRVQAVLAEFKALPANANEQQKDAVRKKFCAIGGEVLGYYKFIQAIAKDCAAKGEKLDALLDVINKQLDLAQQGVKAPCS